MDMLIEFAKYSEHKIIFETYEIALIYYLSALMEKQYNTIQQTLPLPKKIIYS